MVTLWGELLPTLASSLTVVHPLVRFSPAVLPAVSQLGRWLVARLVALVVLLSLSVLVLVVVALAALLASRILLPALLTLLLPSRCTTAGRLTTLLVVVTFLVAPTTTVLAPIVLGVAAVATLLLLGAGTPAPSVPLGSVGAAGGALFVLGSSIVPALHLAALVLALLGLVVLGLFLVVEAGSVRRSLVRRCVGVHEWTWT